MASNHNNRYMYDSSVFPSNEVDTNKTNLSNSIKKDNNTCIKSELSKYNQENPLLKLSLFKASNHNIININNSNLELQKSIMEANKASINSSEDDTVIMLIKAENLCAKLKNFYKTMKKLIIWQEQSKNIELKLDNEMNDIINEIKKNNI